MACILKTITNIKALNNEKILDRAGHELDTFVGHNSYSGLCQCNVDPGEILYPAVLVKTRVCEGCSVLWAHKTSFRSILFNLYLPKS